MMRTNLWFDEQADVAPVLEALGWHFRAEYTAHIAPLGARGSGILCIVERDRADEAWTRLRRSAINRPRTWQLLAGGVAGVALFAWKTFAASGSKRVGYAAMATFDALVLVLLVRLRAFVRMHERPPEWWEGWAGWRRTRRNPK